MGSAILINGGALPSRTRNRFGQETPTAPDISGGSNALMEAEREKERREAALRRQQGREVFTSGLGASGLADTEKKTLLGG